MKRTFSADPLEEEKIAVSIPATRKRAVELQSPPPPSSSSSLPPSGG